jgi:segregation and condensation protein B
MDKNILEKVLESLLFVSMKPLTLEKLEEIINEDTKESNKVSMDEIKIVIENIDNKYKDDSYPWQLIHVAGGYQFVTKKEYAIWIKRLYKAKFTIRLSPSALETISIIAYKQPITKAEIEQIRGVDSTGVVGTLLNRKLIKISGYKETVGAPALYITTQEFLKYFGLNSLKELPLPEHIKIPDDGKDLVMNNVDVAVDIVEDEMEHVEIVENKDIDSSNGEDDNI